MNDFSELRNTSCPDKYLCLAPVHACVRYSRRRKAAAKPQSVILKCSVMVIGAVSNGILPIFFTGHDQFQIIHLPQHLAQCCLAQASVNLALAVSSKCVELPSDIRGGL